jgi:hypothetical protein
MTFLIHHPASQNPYAAPSEEIAEDFRAWGYRVVPFSDSYSFSELTPRNINIRRTLFSIWREEKILHLPQSRLEVLSERIFTSQKLFGVSLTNAGDWVPGRAERYAVAITNVLEAIHESEKVRGEDGVLKVVKEFIDENDAGHVAEQAGSSGS